MSARRVWRSSLDIADRWLYRLSSGKLLNAFKSWPEALRPLADFTLPSSSSLLPLAHSLLSLVDSFLPPVDWILPHADVLPFFAWRTRVLSLLGFKLFLVGCAKLRPDSDSVVSGNCFLCWLFTKIIQHLIKVSFCHQNHLSYCTEMVCTSSMLFMDMIPCLYQIHAIYGYITQPVYSPSST